jgi:hypothetical protein
VEVLEKLEPTIGLEPMTCRLRSLGEDSPGTPQPYQNDVVTPTSEPPPEGGGAS